MTRTQRSLAAALIAATWIGPAGCRDERELDAEPRRPYAPPEPGPSRTVQVRNACPEPVVLAVGPELPIETTRTMTLPSTKVEAITVEQGGRIWLRVDGRFDVEASVVPGGAPIEINNTCTGIYAQTGGR